MNDPEPLHLLDVLIVDDEAGMRAGAERALEGFTVALPDFRETVAFSVRSASTGAEALEELKARTPDIVLLDYKLPDMTGIDVLADAPGAADFLTIMITAFASLEVAVTATKRGAFDFLAKPFTPEELRATITKAARSIYLQRKARRLEDEKRQVRFEFIRVLAHELKSPLAAVEGYMHLMKERMKGPDMAAYDQMIDRSVTRIGGMRKLVMDLLDLTRLESGRKKRSIETVDLARSAALAADAVAAMAAEKKVEVRVDAPAALPLLADSGEVDMILSNLLSNAVKYNREGGRAVLELRPAGPGTVSVRCSDTGIGMTEEELSRLFGEFVRMKNEHTRGIDGSGLGLSILRKVVALYGGEVRVTSRYGEGSSFELTLRDAEIPAPEADPALKGA
ncbi:MAG: Response regulator receiver sensor signal transduction histidine kinase [Elusimicrobia bacterium]|nr:MAG: Response regulator receiver sensor signal transduction histidine kinase [Elusimicrobiota bacterium]KAF0158460.1 MAG: Response regulator receiver sensor signal transduction histidine kinase [Elusimicrobiota bacterium]